MIEGKGAKRGLVVVIMTIMRGTIHRIEGGIGREARVEKDEGEIGAQKDVTMIGTNVITSTNLVKGGGKEAEVTAWIEKAQEESGVLEEMIIEITMAVTAGVVDERMIGINTMIRNYLQKQLQQ